ncbi:MAG: DUF3592 domain-containing protein [Burkholderiales bacterium]|nr:DUF3592 domain-containing protein [Burkholderiales bacterium]
MDETAPAGFSLDVAGEELHEPATARHVAEAVRKRPRGADWYLTLEDEVVILDAQPAADGGVRLSLEEGSRRFQARIGDDDELLAAVFTSVIEGTGRWRDLCDWKEPPPKPAAGRTAATPKLPANVPVEAKAGLGLIALAVLVMGLPGDWMPDALKPAGARMVLLFALAIPGLIVFATLVKLHEVRRAAAWARGSAEITKCEVVAETVSRSGQASRVVNKPAVAYEFSVGLKRFKGHRVSVGEIAGNDPRLQEILQRYRVGARVPVYYDPRNPQDCALERDLPAGFGSIWILAGVLAIVMLAVALFFVFPQQAISMLAPYFPKGAHPHYALFFAVAGLMMVAFAVVSRSQSSQAARWHKATGRVVASRTEGRGSRANPGAVSVLVYEPVVEYAYTVGGREYRGTRLSFGASVAATKSWAEGKAAAYPVEREVTVHYDPSNPAEAVLEPGGSFAWGGLSFALVFLVLAGYFATH